MDNLTWQVDARRARHNLWRALVFLRNHNGQYYVDLNAWRIERGDQAGGAEAGQQPAAVSAAPMPPVPPMPAAAPADDDDLPF